MKKKLRPRCSFQSTPIVLKHELGPLEPGLVLKCSARSKSTHECLACEKKGEAFVLHACPKHVTMIIEQIKKHALTKHPGNLAAAMIAALGGEDVFE